MRGTKGSEAKSLWISPPPDVLGGFSVFGSWCMPSKGACMYVQESVAATGRTGVFMTDVYRAEALPEKIDVDVVRTIEGLESRTFAARLLQFSPDFVVFRKGFSLCLELVHMLGDVVPKDNYDRTQRDLACDTLDSLWCAERALLCGYENQALVLLRRAYETTSLMAYFVNFPSKADEWKDGKMMRQSVIRRELGTGPVPESSEALHEMYRVYSLFSHVKRKTLYQRLLGEGNRLTLGSQGNVSDESVAAVVCELLRQTMWFVEVANFVFAKLGLRPPNEYVERMLGYRAEVQAITKRLPKLLRKTKDETRLESCVTAVQFPVIEHKVWGRQATGR
jgi:hypothetical protein